MVQQWLILTFLVFLSGNVLSQDERYYRQIFKGELVTEKETVVDSPITQFNVKGSLYKFDLNADGTDESLEPQKRDGVDWLEIRDFSERKLFEAKLLAMGAESTLYKIKVVQISPKVKSLILFLDEGVTKARRFESTARIFVLSFENNDLSTLRLTQGPHFFHEKEGQREQYGRRDYVVNVYDIDGDGVREIAIQYNHIQRIMKYLGSGEWSRF
ncbi:MAG TPA: hypothetical protein VNJ01_16705 [Bacteriovoracaceae bacterium]|nr:hypothetical protein [Bacteriovoracaceae bacterium]